MSDELMREQAQAIAGLLPDIMRQLFSSENDPVVDMPLAQLRVCDLLRHGPRSMSAVSRELGVSLSALTQIADRLERDDLVCRVVEESDRRVRSLQLTLHGVQLMRRRAEFRAGRVLATLAHLPPEKRAEVHAALETLLTTCVRAKREPPAVD